MPTVPQHLVDFVFAVCQLGAEPALKAEVARLQPAWRFAFSRPGLVTFRTPQPVSAAVLLPAVFARAFGASLGAAATLDEVLRLAATVAESADGAPLLLHVYARDELRQDEAEVETALATLVEKQRAAILDAAPAGRFIREPRPPRPGETVLDVVVAPDEPPFVGFHIHGSAHSPHPGGCSKIVLPVQAPSRAYRKLEEALIWSRLPLRRGQLAVEIGSAPGGASFALLSRGLKVVGVDPGEMAPQVLADSGFRHVQCSLGELRREQLPAHVDWLLLDVNLAPQVALHGVRRIVSTLRGTLRGVVFTLKLNDWKMADAVPQLLARVAAMGLIDVRATQLPSNRREICVVATAPPKLSKRPRPLEPDAIQHAR